MQVKKNTVTKETVSGADKEQSVIDKVLTANKEAFQQLQRNVDELSARLQPVSYATPAEKQEDFSCVSQSGVCQSIEHSTFMLNILNHQILAIISSLEI